MTPRFQTILDGWARYPALRSERAQASFRRLRTGLLQRLAEVSNPDETLTALDGFLAGLPSGVQIFALFESNPQLVALIVDIAASAPALARYLARNAGVLDAVIGGSFFGPWPGGDALQAMLAGVLARATDYEQRLDAARVWMKEWHFRIGVHQLRGLISAEESGQHYADLAQAVVSGLWPVVVTEFARKHGAIAGSGAAVLGMGSLGAGRLNAASDLDLIVIYDPGPEGDTAQSDGPRPLTTRGYFARLTQSLVTALSAPMSQGRLYEVDMRLRPSGRQGPVATSFSAFVAYQQTDAWTWEHLALTRARVIAGDAALGARIEDFRRSLLRQKSIGAQVVPDVAAMRARLADAKPGGGDLDVKFGPGRMMDIELLAEMLALQTASPTRGVLDQVQQAGGVGRLSYTDQQALLDGYRLYWQVQAALRLVADPALQDGRLGAGGWGVVLRQTGHATAAALQSDLARTAALCAKVIDDLLFPAARSVP